MLTHGGLVRLQIPGLFDMLDLVQLLSDRWASSQTHSFEVWFEIDVTRRALKLARTPQFSA